MLAYFYDTQLSAPTLLRLIVGDGEVVYSYYQKPISKIFSPERSEKFQAVLLAANDFWELKNFLIVH